MNQCSDGNSGSMGGLSMTPNGIVFEYINQDEANFLYEEIFEQNVYLGDKSGIKLKDGDIVFDVGANIGLFSLLLVSEYQNLSVIAIEPIRRNFDVLNRNLQSYKTNHELRVVRFGVGACCSDQETFHFFIDTPGESTRHLNERTTQRKLLTDSLLHVGHYDDDNDDRYTTESCPMTTVSNLMALNQVDHIDLLKIDVEGDELEVLKGIEINDFNNIKQIVVEVHDVQGRLSNITSILQAAGYCHISIQQQTDSTSEDGMYQSFVPVALKLYILYATRGKSY